MYAVVYRWVGACAGRFPRYNYIHLLAEVLVRFARLLSLRLLLCWLLQWQLEEVLLLHCSLVWFYVLLCFVLVFVVVVVIMVVVFIWVAGCWCLAARFRAGDIALFEASCKRNRSSSFKHIQTYSICFGFWLLNVEEVEARAWLILDFEQVMLFKLNVPLPEDPFADAEPWQTNQDKGGNFHLSNSEPSWGFMPQMAPIHASRTCLQVSCFDPGVSCCSLACIVGKVPGLRTASQVSPDLVYEEFASTQAHITTGSKTLCQGSPLC